MTDIALIENKKNVAADTIEIFYTNKGARPARINSWSATNDTESSKTYKAYIYPTDEASPANPPDALIPQTIVVRDTSDNGVDMINKVVPAGGTIRIQSSDADSLNFNVAGLEQT